MMRRAACGAVGCQCDYPSQRTAGLVVSNRRRILRGPYPAGSKRSLTLEMTRPIDKLPPVHPGSILRDELQALGLSARKFAGRSMSRTMQSPGS